MASEGINPEIAKQAAKLLNTPAFWKLLLLQQRDYVDIMVTTRPEDIETREEAYRCLNALRLFPEYYKQLAHVAGEPVNPEIEKENYK